MATIEDPNQMSRHICNAYRLVKPLHLYKVNVTVKLNDAIDLFNYPFIRLTHPAKGLADENASGVEQSIQHPFQ